jgi:hypothetical protein
MLSMMICVLNDAFEGGDETDARNGFEVFETLLIVVRSKTQLELIYQGSLVDIQGFQKFSRTYVGTLRR